MDETAPHCQPHIQPHIQVDPALCDRDGLCIKECALSLLSFGPDGLPVSIPEAAERCIMCGHCIAVCPKAALTLAGLPPEVLPTVDKGLLAPPEAAEQLLRSRRSVRHFRRALVDREQLLQFIDTARYAPSGMNAQPVHWLVVEGRERMLELAGLTAKALRRLPYFLAFLEAWDRGEDVILRGAPNLVVAHARTTGFDHIVDGAIALTYFELAAHAHGVGTCWAGLLMLAAKDSAELQAALGLPEGHQVLGALMAGYPRHGFKRLPPRKAAKVRWL
ncbi:MAG: nitroreductase family protein [Proteobacteria bacterium]|nr:nitroreductase family protein [Pseudomonadota bacterium]